MDTAAHLATVKYDEGCKLLKGDAKTIADIKRRSLLVTIGQMKTEFQKLQTRLVLLYMVICLVITIAQIKSIMICLHEAGQDEKPVLHSHTDHPFF